MIYQISFDVEGEAATRDAYEVDLPPYLVRVQPNAEGRVVKLVLQKHDTPAKEHLPTLSVRVGRSSLTVPKDPSFDDLIALAQYIESVGGFWFQIHRLKWGSALQEWIPESEEERRGLGIFSLKVSQEYREQPELMTPQLLRHFLVRRAELEHLTAPLAFVREGFADFRSLRYVNSFANFYLFLEDRFGGRKTKNAAVERAFLSNPILVSGIQDALRHLQQPSNTEHLCRVNDFLTTDRLPLSVEGLVRLIVKLRGDLFHFSTRSARKKGHPLNHREFHGPAYLLLAICCFVVPHIIAVRRGP